MVGHITIDRKILNWEWYTDIKMFHLFLYLLLKANHKDGNWRGNPVKRGQLITGRFKISADTGLSEREIRTCLSKLKTTNEIAIETTSSFSIITICKYNVYQSKDIYKDQQSDQQIDQPATNQRPTSDQPATTNNNDNNDNNKFNTKPFAENFNGLPKNTKDAAYELIFRTQRVKVPEEDLIAMWEVFKIQNLTGEKWYANEGAVYSHYLNWVKKEKFNDGNKSANKGNRTAGSVSQSRNEALRDY